jgi:hypothetical protein
VVSPAVGAWGVARLAELRLRACRCSRGRRPSRSDSEPRDRHGALPQPHPSGVDGRTTQDSRWDLVRPSRLVCHDLDRALAVDGVAGRSAMRSRRGRDPCRRQAPVARRAWLPPRSSGPADHDEVASVNARFFTLPNEPWFSATGERPRRRSEEGDGPAGSRTYP